MLWLGVLAIASSVTFFIAANWNDFGRFAKFGLLEGLIALCLVAYWLISKKESSSVSQLKEKNTHLFSKAALLLASLFLGVLLAFYGQTYQTGADTWQLFFTWAVLILPWVFVARFPALWIFWIALLNVAAILYFKTFGGFLDTFIFSGLNYLWITALLNLLALVLWELYKKRWQWLSEIWATRALALAGGMPLTILTMEFVSGKGKGFVALLLWLLGMTLIYIVYRKQKIDLFMLAMACLSGISVVISFFFNLIGSHMASFLLMFILIIVLGGLSARWLKKIHKESLNIDIADSSERNRNSDG